ncbi:hypothetical protein [Abiotrophia defectiva]|uniref:hypothetical protein n=1 Tax=Abiotrophia defectiva TaxID=46125 RepID=UPI0026E987CA|nr:hypothetical protein [Abiotrophia defectiva]
MKQNNNHEMFTTLPFGILYTLMGLWCVLNIPSAINKQDQIGLIMSSIAGLLLIPMGISFIFLAFKIRRETKARYEAAYQRYPELRDNLSLLTEQASFVDPLNQFYVYRDTLFYIKNGFIDYQIEELSLIGVKVERMKDAPRISSNHLFFLYMREGEQEMHSLDMGTVSQQKYDNLIELFYYLMQVKPSLRFEDAISDKFGA